MTGFASNNSKCRPKGCQARRHRVLRDRIHPGRVRLLRANLFIKAGCVPVSQFRSAPDRPAAPVAIKVALQAVTAGPVAAAVAPCNAVVRIQPLQAEVDRQVLLLNRRFCRYRPISAAPMPPNAGMIRAVIVNRSAKAS